MTAPAILPQRLRAVQRTATGCFVTYRVDAADRDLAAIQAKLGARREGLSPVDVAQVTLQSDRTWLVELQVADTQPDPPR